MGSRPRHAEIRSIRIDEPTWERIEARAKSQGRTITGQIRWELGLLYPDQEDQILNQQKAAV